MKEFVHLHVHSHYSLLDGACRIEALVNTARQQGMRAIALTDHGNLFGAVDFYTTAYKHGVKPILGMEAYVAPQNRSDRRNIRGIQDASYHLTLLVQDEVGYKNLMKLSTLSYREGFYYRPRVDKDLLSKYSKGLVALSGCPNSEFSQACCSGQKEKAIKVAEGLRDIFGPQDFYLEIQQHGLDDEKKITEGALECRQRLGLKLVATNDIHYLRKEDVHAHDVLLAINTGKHVHDENRLKYPQPEFYLKSPEEMHALFHTMPESLTTTLEIAEKCNLELIFGELHLPHFEPPSGKTHKQFLRELCEEGVRRRYVDITPSVRERLEHELSVIEQMGFVNYFLIVWDLVRFAKENKIPVGPGRGSAAGSMVAYNLGVTDIDPLKHDLIFERFLNPSRRELPDIDIDFCQDNRSRVLDYVKEKYGKDNVSQIITFGTMKAKQVLRDVGRATDMELYRVDAIAKKIPNILNITLNRALEIEPELRRMKEQEAKVAELFDTAGRLEGLYRHASKHAAGVVISDKPLTNYVPLCVQGEDETTQYSMNDLQKLGLLKIDFLGLETLTVLDKAIKLIAKTRGVTVNLAELPLNDIKTFAMLGRGEVKGVFQLETSRGMQDLIEKMKPDRFEDIIATIALFRPGPLQGGMVDKYIRCKHGLEEPQYLHSALKPILEETYGVILYQEQVMRIANQLAGFSMTDADALRKAMGKKIKAIMTRYGEQFIEGAVKRGVQRETAEDIFRLIDFFGGYGFNKSHSTAYGLICYQTAYLKANDTVEYMAALMTCHRSNLDKIAEYVEECRRLNLEVLPPDINSSDFEFGVDGNTIRFGLGAVKNVGDKALEAILAARQKVGKFSSIFEFCERVDAQAVDRRTLEGLIKCGAFDSLGHKRSQLMEALDTILSYGNVRQSEKRLGQLTFFSGNEKLSATTYPSLPEIEEWEPSVRMANEKEALGLYVTANPLHRWAELLRDFSSLSLDRLSEVADGTEITVGGVVSELRANIIKTGPKKGGRYITFRLRDLMGSCEAIVFGSEAEANKAVLRDDLICFVVGRLDMRRERPSLKVNRVIPAEKAREVLAASVKILLSSPGAEEDLLAEAKQILERHPGTCPVFFEVECESGQAVHRKALLRTSRDYWITPSDAFLHDIEEVFGQEHIVFIPHAKGTPARPAAAVGKQGASATA